MFKLRWLQIQKYRSAKPGTRLAFNEGYNVLLGQNGTGKTTLLKLVVAVMMSNFSDIWDEEFDLEYQLVSEDGEAKATIAVRKKRSAAALKATLDLLSRDELAQEDGLSPADLQTPEFSADVELVQQSGASIRMEFREGQAEVWLTQKGGESLSKQLTPPFDRAQLWANALTGIHAFGSGRALLPLVRQLSKLFRAGRLRRFDESLEFFNEIRTAQFSLVRIGGMVTWLGGAFDVPEELSRHCAGAAQERWRSDQYVVGDEHLPFLKGVAQLLGFDQAEAIVQLLEASADENAEHLSLGGLRFLFSRGRERVSDEHLSYGQKRILAFWYYLASTRSMAIADELVNGLHHAWITACMGELGQRQAFLTSQNPLLLDDLPFESAEQVQKTFILCRKDKVGEREQMIWENLTEEAAEDFYESYKVGFQQVGELLQVKGLW